MGNTTPLALCSFFLFFSVLSILEFPMFLFLLGIYVATLGSLSCQCSRKPENVRFQVIYSRKEMKIRLCLSLITNQLLSSHCCSQYPEHLHYYFTVIFEDVTPPRESPLVIDQSIIWGRHLVNLLSRKYFCPCF